MRRALSAFIFMLVLAGSTRATPQIPSDYIVLMLQYRGYQEKPVGPIVVGNSASSLAWCGSVYFSDEWGRFLFSIFAYRHVANSGVLNRLISDVPLYSPSSTDGKSVGREVEITVVERGQVRHIFTRGFKTDAFLWKLILDSGKDTELRERVLQFELNVDNYALWRPRR